MTEERKEYREYYPDRSLKCVYYMKGDKQDGPYQIYAQGSNVVIEEGTYVDGKLDGEYTERYETGKLKRVAHYKAGKFDGEYKEYHRNGKLTLEAYCKDGKFEGECQEYHENGRLKKVAHYKAGELDGEYQEGYEKGGTKILTQYKDGKLEGEYQEFYETGETKVLAHYKAGELDGEYQEYYKNGKLEKLAHYKNGKLDGESEEYESYGREGDWIKRIRYENDNVVESWTRSYMGGDCYKVTHELFENGIIQRKTVSEVTRDGETLAVISDMTYKDGEEYEGFRKISMGSAHKDFPIESSLKITYTKKEGKLHGEYVYRNVGENGLEDSCHTEEEYAIYNNGVLDGPYKKKEYKKSPHGFSITSSIKEGEYKAGKFYGMIRINNEKTAKIYAADECVGTRYYNDQGIPTMDIMTDGTHMEYSEDGKLIKRYHQENGVKHGAYEEFDPSGWRRASGTYKNGELQGFYTEYYSDGNISSQRYFKKGEDCTKWYESLKKEAAKNVDPTGKTTKRKRNSWDKLKIALQLDKLKGKDI